MTYSDKLKDPRWQKKRLEILERDEWTCQRCFDTSSTLHVHHFRYIPGKEPWDYDNDSLLTICAECHEQEKDSRKEKEGSLLEILKDSGFMSEDLYLITTGFVMLESKYPPDVTSSIIKFSLTHTPMWDEICAKYFHDLSSFKK